MSSNVGQNVHALLKSLDTDPISIDAIKEGNEAVKMLGFNLLIDTSSVIKVLRSQDVDSFEFKTLEAQVKRRFPSIKGLDFLWTSKQIAALKWVEFERLRLEERKVYNLKRLINEKYSGNVEAMSRDTGIRGSTIKNVIATQKVSQYLERLLKKTLGIESLCVPLETKHLVNDQNARFEMSLNVDMSIYEITKVLKELNEISPDKVESLMDKMNAAYQLVKTRG